MKCCRCSREREWWFQAWLTVWRRGRFWMCPACVNELLGWWLELTQTLGAPDPTRGFEWKQKKGGRG
jgi:hypothetical protein